MSRRELLAKVIVRSGAERLRLRASRWGRCRRRLTILAYHRVARAYDYPWLDESLISAYPAQFEEQVSYLARNYSVLTFSRLERLWQSANLPENALIITFDDGYLDNYEVAFPILRRYRVPATFFLTTDYIGKRELFWWDRVYLWVTQTPKESLHLKVGSEFVAYKLGSAEVRRGVVRELLGLMKQVSDSERQGLLKQLAAECRVARCDTWNYQATMTWEQVQEMFRAGMEFGAHTATHPILTKVEDVERLRLEIRESKRQIEAHIGRKVNCFCYPVGLREAMDQRVREVLKEEGFCFATSAIHGVNMAGESDPLALRRLWITPQDRFEVFKAKLLFPGVFRY